MLCVIVLLQLCAAVAAEGGAFLKRSAAGGADHRACGTTDLGFILEETVVVCLGNIGLAAVGAAWSLAVRLLRSVCIGIFAVINGRSEISVDAAVGRAVVAVLLSVDVSLVAESNASLKDEDKEGYERAGAI